MVIGCAVVVLLICFTRMDAATLNDYERRVANAAALVEQLAGAYEDESHAEPLRLSAGLDRLRQLLPAKETVEFNGERVAVNNVWLREMLWSP